MDINVCDPTSSIGLPGRLKVLCTALVYHGDAATLVIIHLTQCRWHPMIKRQTAQTSPENQQPQRTLRSKFDRYLKHVALLQISTERIAD
jgi:hypothetical protein